MGEGMNFESAGHMRGGVTYVTRRAPYARYYKAQWSQMVMNGRVWHRRVELAPWTRWVGGKPVTVQGLHTSVYTVGPDGRYAAVKHSAREVK